MTVLAMVCYNGTVIEALKNCPTYQVMFGIFLSMLGLSVGLNICCCASKHISGKRTSRQRMKSRSQRHMEENPIYGNIALQCSETIETTVDSPPISFSSPLRDQQRVEPHSPNQDCYANLTLKIPRAETRPSSPQAHLELDSEKEPDNTDVLSTTSDLYASVQTQRTKTLENGESSEDYANHL